MKKTTNKTTIVDIANALDVSIATVHRAFRDQAHIKPETKDLVLEMAKKLQYRPNLAARSLSSKHTFRISVNTLQGTTSFWNEVRAGIEEECNSLELRNAELEYRTYSNLDEAKEAAAFELALKANVDGIIAFPSSPQNLKRLMRRSPAATTPVVFVATDAPGTRRLSVVAVDTNSSGFLAADLMGRLLRGTGRVGLTIFDTAITEHMEKADAFMSTMARFYPGIHVEEPIEDHDDDSVAYEKVCRLISANPDLAGIYVTTEASMPVIKAARDLGVLERLTIITTDLFPSLANEIRSGKVAATIYQRPRTQGRLAFRVMYDYIANARYPVRRITVAPYLVMRGNLESFSPRDPLEAKES